MDKKKIAKTSLIAVSAVAIAGLAFTAPSLAATPKHASVSSSVQAKGHGSDKGFGNGKGSGQGQMGHGVEVSQDITVTVPDDGATYKLVVTETAPAAATNNTTNNAAPKGFGKRTIVVAVTGTGSVKVTVPGLHPGTYTADLVKVSSTQEVTVAAPAAAATTATK
jgi:hypothetical protein